LAIESHTHDRHKGNFKLADKNTVRYKEKYMADKEETDPVRDQEYALFKRASDPDQDPILSILRVHLLSEYYLERLIHICLPRGDIILDNGNLTFAQKLTLVSAFDVLKDRTIQCLKGLN